MSANVTPRLCAGCGKPLPQLSRPNRRHHDGACRTHAARERQRQRPVPLRSGSRLAVSELEAAVTEATSEVRLVALVAKEANRGSWRAASWLLERRSPERWGPQRPGIAKACRAAGVPLFSLHDLRHRRISLLHLRGVPWARIAEQVGQRNLAVTANAYTHVLTDERELDYASLLA